MLKIVKPWWVESSATE